MAVLVVACAIGSAGLGWLLAEHTDAAHPYWDNGVLLFSLAAMWLTARKLLENWVLWFAVNIVSVPLYFAQDLPWYALLYALYLPMAVWGYASWRRTMREQDADVPRRNETKRLKPMPCAPLAGGCVEGEALVARGRIELPTRGFSVRCSTD